MRFGRERLECVQTPVVNNPFIFRVIRATNVPKGAYREEKPGVSFQGSDVDSG